jgi:putative heme iron utilization protein
MSKTQSRQHGWTTPSESREATPEPSYAERVRTLVYRNRMGTLSTNSKKHRGSPFGSLMPYGIDAKGRPILLISTMAVHTQNLERDPHASLFVFQTESHGDPLDTSRVTLMGEVHKVHDEDIGEARELYLSRYGNASYWVDFDDFSFYRLEIADIYFVGGFGAMGWVTAADYYTAEADPLADESQDIIRHMNEDHTEALLLLAKSFAGVEAEEAAMTAVDRLGFHVRLKLGSHVLSRRIGFVREARSKEEAREIIVEMVRRAREGA